MEKTLNIASNMAQHASFKKPFIFEGKTLYTN